MAHESHYGDFSSVGNPSMQGFEPNHELFGLQAGMEMLGIPSKHPSSSLWGDYSVASNKNYVVPAGAQAAASAGGVWAVDDSSLRTLLQPNRGLAFSLLEPKPSNGAVELAQPLHYQSDSCRDIGLFPRAANPHQQQQLQHFMQEGRGYSHSLQPFQLKASKYLIPAKELLSEFCNLGGDSSSRLVRTQKGKESEKGGPSSSPSWNYHQSLYSMDLLELQRRKAKLLAMLEEVDKRYRKYCEQMRSVVSSFEAVAGEGAATVYSTLASKAMSRHFRSLRDAIISQTWATKKAMGEKDPLAPGTTKGETPRLRLLDQCLRQQKAFQHGGIMESHPWRPQRGLPERSVTILRAWLFEHFLHPYPSDVDKHILARQTGLSRSQVSNWFINARVRLWKPMVEEMYLEEMKEENNPSSDGQEGSMNPSLDQKPAAGQVLNDADLLSSIMNRSHHRNQRDTASASHHHHHQQQPQQHRHQAPKAEHFGAAVSSMDFASYSNYGGHSLESGVSLTLGLQQHSGGGMSLSFSPASQQSLLFSNEHIDNGHPVHFSILDGEAQNQPYRDLVGAQLLHDLAG